MTQLGVRDVLVPHHREDQPCGCDDCMSYGAEDEGFDWFALSPARRLVLRILDSGDERFAEIVTAIREHDAAVAALDVKVDVKRLRDALVMAAQPEMHPDYSNGARDYWSDWAELIAAEYGRLGDPE